MLKKYYDNDDIEYKRIREFENLVNMATDEGYYKAIRNNKNTYIEQESKEDKDKILSIKEYLLRRPHLSDMINEHKREGE